MSDKTAELCSRTKSSTSILLDALSESTIESSTIESPSGVKQRKLKMSTSDSQDELNLVNLPQEVLRIILEFLDDIDSLSSAVSSCRNIYGAFHSFPSPLIASLVHHEIGPAVLPECIQTLRAAAVRRQRPAIQRRNRLPYAEVPAVIQHFFDAQNDAPEVEWSLSNGIIAVRLHSIVNNLAQSIADEYLGHWNSLVPHGNQVPVTESEIERIQRALYRFETYRNLLPPPERADDVDYKGGHKIFFSQYLPWEIEQLGSIYESLWRRAIPVFNEIALHDIEWGEFHTSYVEDYDNLQAEYLLARGLPFIYALITAKTYAHRYELLKCPCPSAVWEFLWEPLSDYNRRVLRNKNLDTQNLSDTSETIWTWANFMEPGVRTVMEDHNRPLRACGYVFWDQTRVDNSGLLDEDWSEMDFELVEDFIENCPNFDAERQSWNIRSALYMKGKRGYWDDTVDVDAILREPEQPPAREPIPLSWRTRSF